MSGYINWSTESPLQRKLRKRYLEDEEIYMTAVQLARITGALGLPGGVGSATPPPKVPAFVTREIPAGLVDGLNTQFVLEHEPIPGSEHIYLNGLLQGDENNGDYMINKNIITFSEAPYIGSSVRCTYIIMV